MASSSSPPPSPTAKETLRKPYRRPQLVLLGSVRNLTFGNSGIKGDGGMMKRAV
jgi:hypothetical protein